MKDVIIVGSGPAGLSASIYASRGNLSTLVIAGDTSGGLITTTETVDNYLGFSSITGMELGDKFVSHAKSLDIPFIENNVKSICIDPNGNFTVTLDNGEDHHSKTVIYAAGSTPKKLGVPGEESNGVSYCATCDGMFSEGEDVIVVGGGESAAEEALYMSNIAKTTTLLIRGKESKASPLLLKKLSQANVKIKYNTEIKEINENSDSLEVTFESGEKVSVNSIFIAIGQSPNSKIVSPYVKMDQDYHGFIKWAKLNGLFIAGDICSPEYRQAIIAAGSGAKAGMDAINYLLRK